MLKNYSRNTEINFLYDKFNLDKFYYNFYKYLTADLVFKDMMYLTQT